MRKAGKTNSARGGRGRLGLYHALLLGGVFLFWYVMTEPGLVPPFYFDDPTRAKFFFGQPLEVFQRIWVWFSSGSIYLHLGVTLLETLLAFAIGTVLGLLLGLWLALSPTASTLADPYIKAMNAMPRVILAPIFAALEGPVDRHFTMSASCSSADRSACSCWSSTLWVCAGMGSPRRSASHP